MFGVFFPLCGHWVLPSRDENSNVESFKPWGCLVLYFISSFENFFLLLEEYYLFAKVLLLVIKDSGSENPGVFSLDLLFGRGKSDPGRNSQ